MAIDLPTALRVLSHELRSPASVLQGYVRMLKDGSVDDEMRASILERLQRAGERIGRIAQQTSDLLHWTTTGGLSAGQSEVSLETVVVQLESKAADTVRLTCSVAPECRAEVITATDSGSAVVDAFLALARTVGREHGTAVSVAFRPAVAGKGVDVCFFPAPVAGTTGDAACAPDRVPLVMDRGGQAMELFVAVAVVDAHHGLVWQHTDGSMIGVTLTGGQHS